MDHVLRRPGRLPEISDGEISVLRKLLAAGKLQSTRAVQAYLSRQVLGQPKDTALSLKTTRTCLRRAGYAPGAKKTALTMPSHRVRELERCPRELKSIVKPVLLVVAGLSFRAAAVDAHLDESTIRYRFRRVRDKGLKGLSMPRADFKKEFFAWCSKVRKPDLKKALTYVQARDMNKSERTLHRLILEWKDLEGVPRRHWTCGGSNHS